MINHKHSILTTINEPTNGEQMSTKPKSNGKTIFVTGVNGHIGNQIVRDLLENGYTVKGSVRDLKDESKTAHVIQHAKDVGVEDRLELVEGDILDADNWAEMITGCDSLFHTATIYSNTKRWSTNHRYCTAWNNPFTNSSKRCWNQARCLHLQCRSRW